MALITFNKKDLDSLVGKHLTEKDYKEVVPMLGMTCEALTDTDVSFDVSPDRPDMYSVEGFARGLKGFLGIETGLPQYTVNKSRYEVHVDKSVLKKRGCAAFAVAKGYKFTDETIAEFMQLQDKLVHTIGRKRKKCAIGTYDLNDLSFPIKYTAVGPNHKFTPLLFNEEMTVKEVEEEHPKGKEYAKMAENWKDYPAYIDAKKNTLAVLPYTGAQFGKIKSDTENLFIEVTGTEWKSVFEMLNIVVTALADRGAKIYQVKTVYPGNKLVKAPDLNSKKMKLDLNYANKLLDLDLKQQDIKKKLEKMRFSMLGNNVLVPAYRTDILHPIDLVEDIAIAHGYEKFEPNIPAIATIGQPLQDREIELKLRRIMLGLSFQEIATFVLSSQRKEFEMSKRKKADYVEILNPKIEDYTITRTSLIPGLLETFSQNASSEMPQRIFELGTTIKADKESETGAVNAQKLCAGILHANANYSELKSCAEAFFKAVGKKLEIKEAKDETFIPGRVVELLINGKSVGVLGEVSPEVLENFGIEYPVVLFELELEKI